MPACYIADLSSPEYEKFLQHCDTAVQPIASVETHGPHLSLCADSLAGDALLARAAERLRADVLILPTIHYAIVVQHGQRRNPVYPGMIGVSDETLLAVLKDVAACLARDGIRKLLLYNEHGGNSALMPVARCQIEAQQPELHVFDYFVTTGMDIAGLFPGEQTGHGCAFETSLDLALCRDHVWLETRPEANPPRRLPAEELSDLRFFPDWVWTTRGRGYIGDPMKASVEQGEQLVEQGLAKLVPALERLARLDVAELAPVELPNEPLK